MARINMPTAAKFVFKLFFFFNFMNTVSGDTKPKAQGCQRTSTNVFFYLIFKFYLSFMNRLTGDKSPYLSAHFYSLALKLCSKYEEEEELKRLAEEVVSTTPPLTTVFCLNCNTLTYARGK